uniref:Metallo-beta-lactamase domain-containing protein n=1 Tax=Chromera velia CCMP2878 TaxID=1169474 RepID=A0A0G4H4L3_9ALVE|eukprot:Cvel_849.t1-p1 / transcript=Cvel_849.t1 / gene=Cvel_849 / organism=Chromera_velia_CCMP2878 / gene_product=Glyoxylase B2, putative / transcript_product=Glyoxylase B2, putative / location=Cvel_scaffold26:121357-122889(-) / protein_length=254 / sequence_SO=supercontig / SO=protein_coding / is_pseudo=false
MDWSPAAARTSFRSADQLIGFLEENKLEVQWIMETHVHADHLSAAQYLKSSLGGITAIGSEVTKIQKSFSDLFNLGSDFKCDGSQFDKLLTDGEAFQVGNLPCLALHTPGHTPACMTYVMGDCIFAGDTIFMPDFGTARCDFPGGRSSDLYDSVQKIYSLPDDFRVFVGHDYAPGREHAWETELGKEKAENKHIKRTVSKEEFVQIRDEKDAKLPFPRHLLAALQVNLRNGNLPAPESNGISYLKLPINVLGAK